MERQHGAGDTAFFVNEGLSDTLRSNIPTT